MNHVTRRQLPPALGLVLCLGLGFAPVARAGLIGPSGAAEEPSMTHRATGTFTVELKPQEPAEGESAAIGRMLLDKRFSGDLDATSQGQMLSFGTPAGGSAGYVAMEQVSGTLAGRRGTFVLQHSGVMNRGEPSLTLFVVPDSGTDDLEGLSGSMAILIEESEHRYEFDYELPARP